MLIYSMDNSTVPPVPGLRLRNLTSAALYDRVNGVYDYSHISQNAIDRYVAKFPEVGTESFLLSLDIEHFKFPLNNNEVFEFSVKQVELALRSYRKVAPYRRIGLYSILPIRNYWSPVNYFNKSRPEDKNAVLNWYAVNEKIRETSDILHLVDYVAPSLYMFDGPSYTIENWRIYAQYNLREATKCEKATYPWIWPVRHGTEENPVYVGDDIWRKQLTYLSRSSLVDGVIVFTSFTAGISETWKEILQEFIDE